MFSSNSGSNSVEVWRDFLEGVKGRICVRTGVERQQRVGKVCIPPGQAFV